MPGCLLNSLKNKKFFMPELLLEEEELTTTHSAELSCGLSGSQKGVGEPIAAWKNWEIQLQIASPSPSGQASSPQGTSI